MHAVRPTTTRCFEADGSTTDLAAVQSALSGRFEVQLGDAQRVRTIWLDTPDSLLDRAGASLRDIVIGEDRTLILRLPHSAEIAQSIPGGAAVRWPARADALPDGPVRAALAPMTDIRAVIPILDAPSVRTSARLLDAQRKAVVDVVLDAPVDGHAEPHAERPAPAALGLRLRLAAVRGYDAQLRRAERLLRPLFGDPIADARGGAPAGAASPWLVPGRPSAAFAADAPAGRALAAVLLDHVDAMEANLAGAIADIDTEYLHDLRVAVRATRSLIKLAGDALPTGVAEAYRLRWRDVGQLTAPTRDLDVLLLAMDGLDGSVDVAGIDGLGPYRSWLMTRRRSEFALLRKALSAPEFAALLDQWRAALDPAAHTADGPGIAELARARVARARKRALKQARLVEGDAEPELQHELRKRIKEMRYLQEAFRIGSDAPGRKREIRALKALQDCLGKIQDTEVLLQSFEQFADTHPRAAARTTMALGALADRQRRRRSEALAALPDLLAPIADKG